MKNAILALFVLLSMTACQSSGNNKSESTESKAAVEAAVDPSVTHVYYIHGKQRCKTCVAVGEVTKKTVETFYGGNEKVRFIEIKTSEADNEALIEKLGVTFNALIVAKGDKLTNLTEQAFATALNNPESLEAKLKETIDSYQQ
ncbi:hypothetical protein MASR1M31_24840 [Porphyromonadaceae bacterium]